MKKQFILLKQIAILLSGIIAFQTQASSIDIPKKETLSSKIMPADFNKMLVYVSSTPFVSVDGSFLVDGMLQGDGYHFHSQVLGLSDSEIKEKEIAAKAFFFQRFGLDFASNDLYFTGFEATPDINYHLVIASGLQVPNQGLPVSDGGFIAAVVNPNGLDLGGEFSGVHVPAGTMFVKGNYKITQSKTVASGETVEKSVVIDYQSSKPILVESDGSFAVSCELYNDNWGAGQAIGATLPKVLNDGRMVFNTRNILTFPPFGLEVENANN